MRSAILAVALVVAMSAAATADTSDEGRGQPRFPLIVQGLDGISTDLPRALGAPHPALRDHGATPASFSISGKRFSCAQIRAMDEVELITDDSYCD
jgi:hypothetical protein